MASLAAAALVLCSCGGSSVDDPADAACPHPPVSFGKAVAAGDHREVSVAFTCEGARLRGTIYLPPGSGRHPAVIWLHGSGEQPRLSYGPLVAAYVNDGIAFFTYDKRGVGESEGKCCPDVYGHFNLVTADAVGAVKAATSYREIDPKQVGFLGASAAGWVAPRAAETSGGVAFLALASAGVLQHSLVARYEEFAGGSESTKPRPTEAEIAEKLASFDRSGFDPKPYLLRLDAPALWLYGGADRNVPPVQSVGASSRRTGRSSSSRKPGTASSTTRRPLPPPPRPRSGGSATTSTPEMRPRPEPRSQTPATPLSSSTSAAVAPPSARVSRPGRAPRSPTWDRPTRQTAPTSSPRSDSRP